MGLRLSSPSKRVVVLTVVVDIKCEVRACCFPLRAVAFRGQRFSFLGSKNHFLRDLQLGLGLRTAHPIENHCAYSSHQKALLLFPQDKEGFGSIYIARRKLVCIFEKSTALRSNQLVERFKSSFQVSKSKVTGC